MATSLLKAINIIGSRKKLASAIGTTTDAINAWLNRNVHVPLEFAFEIQRVTQSEVHWTHVAPHLANYEKRWKKLSLEPVHAIPLQHLALSNILKTNNAIMKPMDHIKDLTEDIATNGLMKPIAVDTDNYLIFGNKRLQSHIFLNKKTIACWRLSLKDLLEDNYVQAHIEDYFSYSDRVAIGNALENYLKTQLHQTETWQDIVKNHGRIDNFLAKLLKFGNRQNYQNAKNICYRGIPKLIHAIDSEEISISIGAQLLKLSTEKQEQLLQLTVKEIKQAIKPNPLNLELT